MSKETMRTYLMVLCCVIGFSVINTCDGTQAIWDHLFVSNHYNKHIRPSKAWGTSTQVNFSFSIISVIEFNEVKETISVTGKLFLSWTDDFLQWEPGDFANVSHIHVPQTAIWKPYFVLENSVSGQAELGTPSLQVLVSSIGVVEWAPIHVFHTTCGANVQRFPFDIQVCSMTFEASGYAKSELEMVPVHDYILFHEYGGTSGWTITNTRVDVEDDGDVFHLVCSIKMSRNPVYFLLNIFLPISMLSFLNICVFILPVQSGEKASFVVTMFLSLAVFLTIVSGQLPENSESIAYLNIYVFISTLLSTIIAIVTIILIRIYNRDSSKPVPWYLARLVLRCSSSERIQKPSGISRINPTKENGFAQTKVEPFDPGNHDASEEELPEVDPKDARPTIVSWHRVAKALDNICFCVFLVINITMTITILVIAAQKEQVDFAHHEENGH